MSASPEHNHRPADRIVSVLSHWLARHVDDDALLRELEGIGTAGLSAEQAEAVDEVVSELRHANGRRGDLEMVVRETLEVVALGG